MAKPNQTTTKTQVKKLMAQHGITGELSGAGMNWEVEVADDKAARAFQKKVAKVGGYRCGHGGWVLRPGYATDGRDYCDKASRAHY
jgi:hypothetical protein